MAEQSTNKNIDKWQEIEKAAASVTGTKESPSAFGKTRAYKNAKGGVTVISSNGTGLNIRSASNNPLTKNGIISAYYGQQAEAPKETGKETDKKAAKEPEAKQQSEAPLFDLNQLILANFKALTEHEEFADEIVQEEFMKGVTTYLNNICPQGVAPTLEPIPDIKCYERVLSLKSSLLGKIFDKSKSKKLNNALGARGSITPLQSIKVLSNINKLNVIAKSTILSDDDLAFIKNTFNTTAKGVNFSRFMLSTDDEDFLTSDKELTALHQALVSISPHSVQFKRIPKFGASNFGLDAETIDRSILDILNTTNHADLAGKIKDLITLSERHLIELSKFHNEVLEEVVINAQDDFANTLLAVDHFKTTDGESIDSNKVVKYLVARRDSMAKLYAENMPDHAIGAGGLGGKLDNLMLFFNKGKIARLRGSPIKGSIREMTIDQILKFSPTGQKEEELANIVKKYCSFNPEECKGGKLNSKTKLTVSLISNKQALYGINSKSHSKAGQATHESVFAGDPVLVERFNGYVDNINSMVDSMTVPGSKVKLANGKDYDQLEIFSHVVDVLFPGAKDELSAKRASAGQRAWLKKYKKTLVLTEVLKDQDMLKSAFNTMAYGSKEDNKFPLVEILVGLGDGNSIGWDRTMAQDKISKELGDPKNYSLSLGRKLRGRTIVTLEFANLKMTCQPGNKEVPLKVSFGAGDHEDGERIVFDMMYNASVYKLGEIKKSEYDYSSLCKEPKA